MNTLAPPESGKHNSSSTMSNSFDSKKSNYIERAKMKNSPCNNIQIAEETSQIESQNENINSALSALSSSSASSASSNNLSQQSNGNINQTNTLQLNTAIDSALRKYGWLYKLSQNGLKLWRKRYFVLTDYILDYYSDSSMTKHCGTIFLNNTHSRPTVKKDGTSAHNKKNSFKVTFIILAFNNFIVKIKNFKIKKKKFTKNIKILSDHLKILIYMYKKNYFIIQS